MGSVNKVILLGNLGADAEIRYTSSQKPVVRFNLATTEKWRDKSGQDQERTEWHRVVVWDKQGEAIHQYLIKGKQVYVEGKIRSRSWEGKDGQKKYTTEIVADAVVLLGGGRGGAGDRPASRPPGRPAAQDEPIEPPPQDVTSPDPEDIPF
jgi:single-strand DNA-binding protein